MLFCCKQVILYLCHVHCTMLARTAITFYYSRLCCQLLLVYTPISVTWAKNVRTERNARQICGLSEWKIKKHKRRRRWRFKKYSHFSSIKFKWFTIQQQQQEQKCFNIYIINKTKKKNSYFQHFLPSSQLEMNYVHIYVRLLCTHFVG